MLERGDEGAPDILLRSSPVAEFRGELFGEFPGVIWYCLAGKSAEPKELRGLDRVAWKGIEGGRLRSSFGTPQYWRP